MRQQAKSASLDAPSETNLRAVKLLYHTKLDRTVRYLGVEMEGALNISEGIDL